MWCQQPFFDQAPLARQMTEETISMKLTWHGHSAFRIEAGAAKILIDPFCPITRPGTRGGSAAVQARTRHGATPGGGR